MARMLTFPRYSRLAALFALLAACKSPSGSDAGAAKASAAPAPPPAPPAVVDLLLQTDAKVTVSSRVDNPTDYPEHLIDGRPETAWNSKTGDLHGWIEVVLPPEVRVTSIGITAGFDKKKGKGDLFSMNHRISKLRILRDRAVVKEVTLDTTRRDLQHIPIALEATGGTWRIEVLETLPGTKKEWKELVVSDLKMFGIAGAARLATPVLPRVSVAPGSGRALLPWDPDSVWIKGRSGTSLRELCDEFTADMKRAIREAHEDGVTTDDNYCRVVTPAPTFEGSLPIGWKAVHAVELELTHGSWESYARHLVVEGSDGRFSMGPRYAQRDDIGCFSMPAQRTEAFREARRGAQNWLVISRTLSSEQYVEGAHELVPSGTTVFYEAVVCAITGTNVACPDRFTTLDERVLDAQDTKAFTAKLDLRWPKLDVDGGVTGAAAPTTR